MGGYGTYPYRLTRSRLMGIAPQSEELIKSTSANCFTYRSYSPRQMLAAKMTPLGYSAIRLIMNSPTMRVQVIKKINNKGTLPEPKEDKNRCGQNCEQLTSPEVDI